MSACRHSRLLVWCFFVSLGLVAGCSGGSDSGDKAEDAQTDAPAANPLLNHRSEEMNQRAPIKFKAKFETSKGDFVIAANRAWAPNGADRFYNLVKAGFYDDCRFFRVLEGFMAQFGIHGDPMISSVWQKARIPDDTVAKSNRPGFVTYAKSSAPNSRTTQLFINYVDNSKSLDPQGFAPFGEVVEGMEVVNALNGEYGEGAPSGRGPEQGRIAAEGNVYLNRDFPNLDYIIKATIVEE